MPCLFLNKVAAFLKKENLTQVFSCQCFKISKNKFSYRTPPVAASDSRITILLELLSRYYIFHCNLF